MTDLYVRAVASTSLHYETAREFGYITHCDRLEDSEPDFLDDEYSHEAWEAWAKEAYPSAPDELHEIAGRGCYQSWHRPNPKTQSNKDYLRNIIDVQHESVLGHAHVTFAVKGVSRALLLELERHQEHMNINFSVVSQRYVDHSKAELVIPPLLEKHLDEKVDVHLTVRQAIDSLKKDAQDTYELLVEFMKSKGYDRKEIRGAARAVLPENTETKFLVTGSIRAWRDIIRKRAVDGADIEIRLFALEVLKELVRLAPNSVQDFAEMHGIEGDN